MSLSESELNRWANMYNSIDRYGVSRYDPIIVLRIIKDYDLSMYHDLDDLDETKLKKILKRLENLKHITKDHKLTPKGKQLIETIHFLVE